MNKKVFKKYLLIFLFSAAVYGGVEILWRGRTHPTMLLAGGICGILLLLVNRVMKGERYLYKCIVGSLVITAVELVFGLIFNIGLKQNIWDYSNLKFNFLGQISLLFTVIWGFICAAAFPILERMNYALQKES